MKKFREIYKFNGNSFTERERAERQGVKWMTRRAATPLESKVKDVWVASTDVYIYESFVPSSIKVKISYAAPLL